MSHRAEEILQREGFKVQIKFTASKRWVSFKRLIEQHPELSRLKVPENVKDLLHVDNDGGITVLNRVRISGPTLFHMGHTDVQNIE